MSITKDFVLSQQVLAILFSVTNKLQMRGDKYLQDLTIRQMLAIPAIFHTPDGKATINHIARELGTTKQSAKQIVDVMEKKKYLSTAPSERDKRAVDVAVTPEGKRAFSMCSERTDLFLADIFHDFTTEDLETFCALLNKLYRFDGAEQENFKDNMSYSVNEEDEILQYHQNYLKRRTDNNNE
jgi:DNA-binding MarR family transcriptional regulator